MDFRCGISSDSGAGVEIGDCHLGNSYSLRSGATQAVIYELCSLSWACCYCTNVSAA